MKELRLTKAQPKTINWTKIDPIIKAKLNNFKTLKDFANHLNISQYSLRTRLIKLNLKRNNASLIDWSELDPVIIEKKGKFTSLEKFAHYIGVSPHVLSRRLKELEQKNVQIKAKPNNNSNQTSLGAD